MRPKEPLLRCATRRSFSCRWRIWWTWKRSASAWLKEKQRLEQEIARSQGKLNNPGFVGKAPAAVVQKEQENLARNQEKLAQLNAQMKAMGNESR